MRHLPFLKALAKANDSGDPVWRDAAPGYLVLRFFDRWLEDGPAVMAGDPALPALKARIRSAGLLAPQVRRTLLQFVDGLVAAPDLNPGAAIGHLFDYGDHLQLMGHASLAGHVYSTIAEILERTDPGNSRLPLACIQYGITSRVLGEFEVARVSFERAAELATKQNDFEQMVRARAGVANLLKVQGNLPAAEQLFTELVTLAHNANKPVSEAYMRHLRGAVFHARGRYDEAMRDFYFAYETLSGEERESILGDLAAVEVDAGYRHAARDVHRLLAYTAQSPRIRSTALVNLIELAVLDDDERAYDRACLDFTAHRQAHQVQVEHAIYATFYMAMGVERFGSIEKAIDAYRAIATEARNAKIHQVEFEAENKLAHLLEQKSSVQVHVPQPALVPPAELRYITDTISATVSSVLATKGLSV